VSRGSRYNLVIDASAPPWAQQMQVDINRTLLAIQLDMKPKRIAKVDLPVDGSERLAIVTDEVGGAVLAFFDDTDWRRVTDRAVVA